MNFGDPMFVLAIVAISTLGWVMTTAIRARHGYPVTDDWGRNVGKTDPAMEETARALTAENDQLRSTVGRLEERLKVLERIATDPGTKIADQIEQLR
jgi:cell division protein FtsB